MNNNNLNTITNYDKIKLFYQFNLLLKNKFIEYEILINDLKIDQDEIQNLINFKEILNLDVFYKIESHYKYNFFSLPKSYNYQKFRLKRLKKYQGQTINNPIFNNDNLTNTQNYHFFGKGIIINYSRVPKSQSNNINR